MERNNYLAHIALLEAQNRQLRLILRGCGAMAVLLAVLFVSGWKSGQDVPDVIRARRFEVLDDLGRAIAILTLDASSDGSLVLKNGEGYDRFIAQANRSGFGVWGYNQFHDRQLYIGTDAQLGRAGAFIEFTGGGDKLQLGSFLGTTVGSRSSLGLVFRDKDEKTSMAIRQEVGGQPRLFMKGAHGHLQAGALPEDRIGLELFGTGKKPLLSVAAWGGRWPSIDMRDRDEGSPLATWFTMNGQSWMGFSNYGTAGKQEHLSINEVPNRIKWTQLKEGGKTLYWPPDPVAPAPAKKPPAKKPSPRPGGGR